MKKLIDKDELKNAMEDIIEKQSFRVPYNGTNDFYDEVELKSLEKFKDTLLRHFDSLHEHREQDGWISVDERLPEENEITVIGHRNNKAYPMWYEYGRFYSTGSAYKLQGVTHWQSLPEPPKINSLIK